MDNIGSIKNTGRTKSGGEHSLDSAKTALNELLSRQDMETPPMAEGDPVRSIPVETAGDSFDESLDDRSVDSDFLVGLGLKKEVAPATFVPADGESNVPAPLSAEDDAAPERTAEAPLKKDSKEQGSIEQRSTEPVIRIRNLSKIFVLGREKVKALAGVSLDIYKNEIVCLLGTSGSGKSTLLNMMAGLEKPTKGSITIYGQRVDLMSERKLAMFRQKTMGFVFQAYNLLPNLNAIDNVSMPLMFSGVKRRVRNAQAKKMLKMCGLGKRMRHKPTQMSGGQQQRVGIARAFVGRPKIVFADEPTGNLDTRTTIEIMEMMVSMARENHQTLVIVTHDVEIAAYADRIYHIIDGEISSVEDNSKKQISVGSEEAAEIVRAAESV